MTIKASVVIDPKKQIGTINPNIYGHFAEHLGRLVYDGIWVGVDSKIPNINGIRKDIVEALKLLKPPVVRWPGGCFADDYHWKDGVGPREKRPRRVNLNWNSIDTNEFGTHEFLQFCELIGAKPYICSNVGSGTPQEMREWLEYLNYSGDSTLARLRRENGHPNPYNIYYWGIGNENWGCGGSMSPKYYAYEYKRFATYAQSFNDQNMFRIACGPNSFMYNWTRGFFRNLCENKYIGCPWRLPLISGFAMHYYCTSQERPATEYNKEQWYNLFRQARKMEKYIKWHKKIMNFYDKKKRVGLIVDEWGAWHKVETGTEPKWLYQQNTIRDALVAAITLDIFNRNADKVVMSNIAQTVNVLQAMILTQKEKILLTPTYHVYKMYTLHQGGESLSISTNAKNVKKVPVVSGSCSRKEKTITLTLVNSHANDFAQVYLHFKGIKNLNAKSRECLLAENIHAHNTFDEPNSVIPKKMEPSVERLELPPASVSVLRFEE